MLRDFRKHALSDLAVVYRRDRWGCRVASKVERRWSMISALRGRVEWVAIGKTRAGRLCGVRFWTTPASLLFGADLGAAFAQRGQDLRGAGVDVAPPEIGVHTAGQVGVAGVVAVVEHEVANGPKWHSIGLAHDE